MKRIIRFAVLLLVTLAVSRLEAGQPACGNSPHGCSLGQFAPAGGWHPDGGLLHWWSKCCFPDCGTCDDYCRKPLPCVCRPCYSHYYKFGPPEICYGQCGCGSGPSQSYLAPVVKDGKR
jgi:hypothetical protein